MKICPRCQKTYTEDDLNFCLDDGSVLTQYTSELPQTQVINDPRPTHPQPLANQPISQPGSQPAWNTPQYSMQQPQKPSRTWIWVLLILGGLILLCGGGFIGLLAFIGSQAENSGTTFNARNVNIATSNSSGNKGTSPGNSTTFSPSSRTDLESVDLSTWVREFSAYGNTEFTNGEFVMSAKKKGFYYVLVAPEEYQTDEADTKVSVRNVDNASGSLGYGLIFHSNPTPLQQDYAFLIDTKRKKYRVVHHEPQQEKSVVTWTSTTAIKEGSEENILEVRDLDDKIELYINGTMVTSIKNVYGFAGGVPGLYAGDGVKVAFKNLEIRK